jgi:hypothetical protein
MTVNVIVFVSASQYLPLAIRHVAVLAVYLLVKIAQLSVDTQFVFIAQQNVYHVTVYKKFYTFTKICTYQYIQCDIYTLKFDSTFEYLSMEIYLQI